MIIRKYLIHILISISPCRVLEDIIPETYDCGDKVARWLTAYLGQNGLRLLYHAQEKTQRPVSTYEQKFSKFAPTDKVCTIHVNKIQTTCKN